MSHKRILFVDNDRQFLDTRTQFLEKESYQVVKAYTVAEAEQRMRTEPLHLAIIDIRLIDDNWGEDESGLELAKREEFRSIPKIILTNWPTFEAMRAMMRRLQDVTPALDFVRKKDGPEALLNAVGDAFANQIPVNWQLVIQSAEHHPVTLLQIVTLLGEQIADDQTLSRAEELDDLLRRLFTRHPRIGLDRLFWHRGGRVALAVSTFDENELREEFILTCGLKKAMHAERQGYEKAAPTPISKSTPPLQMRAETVNLAAHAYQANIFVLETAAPLKELYRQAADRTFQTALQTLCEQVLPEWHRGQRLIDEHRSLSDLYREKLGLLDAPRVLQGLEQSIRYLSRQAPKLGVRVEADPDSLSFHFASYSCTYANPSAIYKQAGDAAQPAVEIVSPGHFSGDNILVAQDDQIRLTDFASAGLWPSLWNFVALETLIRFEWAEGEKLQSLHEMEQHLTEKDFSRFDPTEVEPALRKPLRAIQFLRRTVAETDGHDWQAHQWGIFFQAIQRLGTYGDIYAAHPPSPMELLRQTHTLLAAAMIGTRLKQHESPATPATGKLRLDQESRTVWIEGAALRLQGLSYEIFCYLFERAGRICTRQELIENVFHERFIEDDASQAGKLNTAMSRLRDKIETNPNRPRFLLTEPGHGYRLKFNQAEPDK